MILREFEEPSSAGDWTWKEKLDACPWQLSIDWHPHGNSSSATTSRWTMVSGHRRSWPGFMAGFSCRPLHIARRPRRRPSCTGTCSKTVADAAACCYLDPDGQNPTRRYVWPCMVGVRCTDTAICDFIYICGLRHSSWRTKEIAAAK